MTATQPTVLMWTGFLLASLALVAIAFSPLLHVAAQVVA
jgi:hypothetical protein